MIAQALMMAVELAIGCDHQQLRLAAANFFPIEVGIQGILGKAVGIGSGIRVERDFSAQPTVVEEHDDLSTLGQLHIIRLGGIDVAAFRLPGRKNGELQPHARQHIQRFQDIFKRRRR